MTPDDEIRELAQKRRKAKAADDAALAERNARIYELVKPRGPMTQAAICRATELTREQIVRILKAETERRAKSDTTPAE